MPEAGPQLPAGAAVKLYGCPVSAGRTIAISDKGTAIYNATIAFHNSQHDDKKRYV